MPLPDSSRLPPVRALSIASGKGGVGKTCISVNLGVALAQSSPTLLLDTDLGLANVDIMLGLCPTLTLADVIAGTCAPADAIMEGPGGLLVLPAASGKAHMADLLPSQHVGLVHVISQLRHPITHLVVDNAAGISDGVQTFCHASHDVVLVACDDPTSITDTYALIKVLTRDRGVRRIQVLSNKVDDGAAGQKLFGKLALACDKFLDVNLTYLGHVPRDPYMRRAIQRQQPVVTAYPGSPSARALLEIADRISGWAAPVAPSGNVEFFMERMLASAVRAA